VEQIQIFILNRLLINSLQGISIRLNLPTITENNLRKVIFRYIVGLKVDHCDAILFQECTVYNALKQDMLDYNLKHGESGYILKGDITKFFYTIDHDILKRILRNYFDDEGVLWLCDLIIDSTEGKGLPLGNQSSQVFALLYLHSLDTLITDKLGIEYYGRYMDDFYLIHHSKDYLKHCRKVIEGHIDELHLSLNGKTQIMPIKNGIKFLGFHTYVSHGKTVTRIRNENKRNAFRKYKKMARLVVEGKMSLEKFEQCYSSWKSHARFGDCEGLINDFDKQIAQILKKEGVTDEICKETQ